MTTAANTAPRMRESKDARFMSTLRDTGNVTAACMVSGHDRSHIYQRRKEDTQFAAAWDEALDIAVDKLEHVARHRAITGVKEPIYYKGELIDHVYKPSDRLLEFLLKGNNPDKFNPVQKLEHSGGVSVSVMQFGGISGSQTPITLSGDAESVTGGSEASGASLPYVDNQAPGARLPDNERGGVSEGPTPKLAASQNDEASDTGIFIENFSRQSHTKSKDIDDENDTDER